LYYEEERRKAKERQAENANQLNAKLGRKTNSPDLEFSSADGETAEILRKKAGVGKSNMYYLLAVYRNRPDLFERVFNADESGK
jgi:hypothetical protein